ncbi:MAG: hypothetical protein S4CHLAM81_10010 [Chlamydiales bacterium]|nr:hypothetical protein [Chlamydiales bacterium]MCH9635779.1 hypothetical protein [Chlamydiales bacterium]MCH9704309.1 50S ribosomal protein L24 [Chlamydiota bacterium]
MVKSRINVGDEVVVIAGNDKGRSGKVVRKTKERIVVEGVNVRKKHMKRTQENQQGQILDIECPIHISNVMAFADGKGRKLRAHTKDGKKEIYYLDAKKKVPFRAKVKGKK